MNTKNIDQLNIILILTSLLMAIKLPFELFLFSYAFIGPLHYLTEINWLQSKSFFVKRTKWIWLLLLLTAIISIPSILNLPILASFLKIPAVTEVYDSILQNIGIIILTSLLFAIGVVHFEKNKWIVLFFIASTLISILALKYVPLSAIAVTVFLPTLIHIYFFTLLFMIYGNINNKSFAGVISIILLLLVPFVVFNLPIDSSEYILSETTKQNYSSTNLEALNIYMARILGANDKDSLHLNTDLGIKVQIFIAFAYTYHYLNWFSKTSIIGWNKTISKSKLLFIIVIWLGSIILYLIDYKTGLAALFFLGFLHIILEFPLNVVSIKSICLRIKQFYKT